MTTILVTGTSGHLGRLVVESLLENGTSPGDIVATARRLSVILHAMWVEDSDFRFARQGEGAGA